MYQTIRSFSVTVSVGFVFFFMLLSIEQGFEKNVLPSCTTLQAFLDLSALQGEDDKDVFCTQRRTAPQTKTLETEREPLLFSKMAPLFPLDATRKLTTQYSPGVTVPPPIL
jgi:hypothetical protein